MALRGSLIALLVVSAAALTPSSGAQTPSTLALVGASVIPMDRERVLAGQTILVSGDRITAIGPVGEVKVPADARRIDASGKYVIPALAEMHAHIPGGQASDEDIERVLYLYAANGIGTIRGMLGHPRHLTLRERANRGELVSPWIYTSGPSLNGNTVPTPEAARKAVADQKAAGYDFLKIHPGILRGPFDALADAANEAGIRMAGHVPADVGLERALKVPYASIDHLDGYIEALAGPDAPASQLFGVNLVDKVDTSRIPELVKATKEAGVSVVPTEALLEHWVGPDDPAAMAGWPEMRYVSDANLASWQELKRKFQSAATEAQRARFLEIRRTLIKSLHGGGVRLLLGSDAPQTWNVPGFSIHRELQYLVRAGLTPYQALETGTRNIAAFFGTESERGTIERGKRADLVVLDANPLEDVASTGKVAAVVLGGRLLTRDEMDERLAEFRYR
ncbi:MAG TPA: amidohydrolase family protein [Vicinamibacterales bacterium]|nr:amidohydrolase family protein [Vicinamibacterales bacterium]